MALLLLVGKASVVLAAAFAGTLLFRRRSAAIRHWILAVGILSAAAVPALQWLTPAWTLPDFWPRSSAVALPAATDVMSATASDVNPTSTPAQSRTSPVSWTAWLLAGWLSGAAGALVILFAGVWRVRQVLQHTAPLTGRVVELANRIASRLQIRHVTLVEGSNPALLVTSGWWQPRIVLPTGWREWSDDKLRCVLSHELAHVQRRDWLVQLGAEAVRCFYWFNPLFWLAARRLRVESERACDDAVLCDGVDAASYASHLLDIARAASRSRALPLALGMAHSTSLERRVRDMFGERMDRRPVTLRDALAATLAMLTVAVPIAASTMERGEQVHVEPLAAVSSLGSLPLATAPATTTSSPLPARPERRQSPKMESAGNTTPVKAVGARPTPATAQREVPSTGSASVSGIVRGSAGAPMAGASVVMTDVATGAVRAEKTAADGRFAFFAVPAARYSVTVSNPGWVTGRHDVAVEDGQQADTQFALKMGVLSEVVTVAAGVRGGDSAPAPGLTPRPQASNGIPSVPTRLCDANGRNCLIAPVKLVDVRPIYPPEALATGAQGVVILEATIGQSGRVTDARVLRGIDPALNASALDAVKQWEFTPTRLDGVPTAIIMSVTVNFSIP